MRPRFGWLVLLLPCIDSFSGLVAPCGQSRSRAPPPAACASEEDTAVLVGDSVVLVGYGAVQGAVDALLSPLAADGRLSELLVNPDGVANPLAQASALAAAWVSVGRASGAYRIERTRGVPPLQAVFACAAPWVCSCAALLALLALAQGLGLGPGPSQAEVEFLLGSLTVAGAWRLVAAAALPRA